MKSRSGSGSGSGNGAGEFDAFLAGLAAVVAERVRELGAKPGAPTDPVFFDETKTVVEWPELSAYVIEELR
ncbi:MAG TPA: hypothetical protein VM033_00150 [Gemmatimonadaceae bacterium]|nr:hypothetical protein [Gemmatimonadaceae bacterium]